jgi:hypothetical protein
MYGIFFFLKKNPAHLIISTPGVLITSLSVIAFFIQSASSENCAVGNYAGSSSSGFSGDGGDALSAEIFTSSSGGVWVDTSQKLFIADYGNNRVRVVIPDTKAINTFAGQ